jgi:hypothetical protein
MKKILLILVAVFGFYSCSTDDAATVTTEPENNTPADSVIAPHEYKIFINQAAFPLSSYTYKTKTGNGAWVQHQLQNWRFPVHQGDSIYISSNGQYTVNQMNYLQYQVNTVVDYWDERNYTEMIQLYGLPIDRKWKLNLPTE